ncbi:MAG: hypothetical protein ACREJG_09720 [Candidatus Rokuibacteriota bacterium]
MSTVLSRRTAIVSLLVMLVGASALAVAPFDAGALRLSGVSLLWWYAGLAAPAVAVALTAVALTGRV